MVPAAVLSLLVETKGASTAAAQLRTLDGAARKTADSAHKSAAALKTTGSAANKAASSFSLMSASAKQSESSVQGLTRSLGRVARFGGVAGAFALGKFVKDGVAFNATMEQNKIAFTQFLGSAKAAKKELRELYQIAKTTPFEFKDVTLASRKLMAMGFTAKETNKELRLLADAASGAALGADAIDRMVLALGQIKSKGVLQMEDLRQLQELGVLNFKQLATDLGLTVKEMRNIGKVGVPAAAAIEAVNRQFQGTFGGQSAKQAQTLNGQISTLKDNYHQFAGAMTTSAFDFSKTLFGKLNTALTEINDEFRKHPNLSLGAKITIAKDKLAPVAKEITDTLGDKIQQAHLGDKIVAALDKAIPVVAKSAGQLGLQMAKSFAKAFVQGDALTKLALGAFFISKFAGWQNIFRKLGSTAGKRFGAQFAASSAAGISAEVAANGAIGGALVGERAISKWRKFGRIAGGTVGAAAAIAIAHDISQSIEDALHRSGPNKGGRQDATSGGQFSLSEAIANALGINQGHKKPGTVNNTLSKTLNAITKLTGKAGYHKIAKFAAQGAGIDVNTFLRQIQRESGFDPNAKSGPGALGIAQFMPGTAKGLGINPRNPKEALYGAARLMASYVKRFGSMQKALIAYDAGPGHANDPWNSLPKETRDYVNAIIGKRSDRADTGPIKFKRDGAGGDKLMQAIRKIAKKRGTNQTVAGLAYDVQQLFGAEPGVGKIGHPKYTASGNVSDHFYGNAIDIPAEGAENVRIAHWLQKNFGKYIKQLIYSGNDSKATGFHGDHVHLAIKNQPGLMKRILKFAGQGDRGGLPFSGKFPKADNVFHAPSISQADLLGYMQSRLEHFDLMVQAGLMTAAKALIAKRKAVRSALRGGALTGDSKLQALIALRALGGGKTPAEKTWTPEAKQRLAMAIIQANPGNVGNLPAGVLKAAGASATLQNPWLQAFQTNLTNQVGAGKLTQAQADSALADVLTKSLPFLTGQDAADVRTKLFEIATNTKDGARAALDAANSLRSSGISDAQFLGGLTGPGADAVKGVLSAFGIDALPGGGSISEIGNTSAASILAQSDIGTLMGEVRAGQVSFEDVWPQILSDLGVIASGAEASAEASNAATEAVDALTAEVKKNNEFAAGVTATQLGSTLRSLADFINGQIYGNYGQRSSSASSGQVARY